MPPRANRHILTKLTLPDRYEGLSEVLGSDAFRLLVDPGDAVRGQFESIHQAINTRHEGMFVPLMGAPGAGKTTLAMGLTHFFPSLYAPTVQFKENLDIEAVREHVARASLTLAANDDRIIPVLLDDRERYPPTAQELGALKRFLRAPSIGARCVLLWPETDAQIAKEIASHYERMTGDPGVQLPLDVSGPAVATWQAIARDTMIVCNNAASVSDLGVDPKDYNPLEFSTIGLFIRKIANDFNANVRKLLTESQQKIHLVIVWVSESADPGILSHLTNSSHLGLLDSNGLLGATSGRIGQYWTERRGLLSTVIFKLDARCFCLPPAAAIAVLRRYSEPEISQALEDMGIGERPPAKVAEYIGRTDLGRHLLGALRSASETRGNPADDATVAFRLLSEQGFTHGRDKPHNKAMRSALDDFLRKNASGDRIATSAEESLRSGMGLIPDNKLVIGDEIYCIEYTWRGGDFLSATNRGTIAAYILEKLKNYAVALGWTSS